MHAKRRFTAAVVAAGGLLLLAVFIGVQQFHSVNRDEIGREHFFSPEKPARLGIRSREETQAVALQAILENKTVLVVLVQEEERHCPAAPGPIEAEQTKTEKSAAGPALQRVEACRLAG